jgi:hypothetical protein
MQRYWLKPKPMIDGTGYGLSDDPPWVQGSPTATPANAIQKTSETQYCLDSLFDLHADLPYTTIVEELEEFVYQSELSQA